MIKAGLLNISLRALTMASKFVLLFFMARVLSPAEIGVYGLMTVTIPLALYVLGFDFYTYSTRELLKHGRGKWASMIRDQFAFHALAYVIVLPLLLIPFFVGVLSWKYVAWFYLLLVLEHVAQEFYRILVTFSRPLLANLALFFRSGAWCYAVIVLMQLRPSTRCLSTIWLAWLIGSLLGLIIPACYLRGLGWRKAVKTVPNWQWITHGAGVASRFLGSTLAVTAIVTLDRYFLKYYHGDSAVGVYTFYSAIYASVQVFVDTGVTMIMLPKLVEAYQNGRFDEYSWLMRQFARNLGIAVVTSCLLAAVGIYPVLLLIHKPIYLQHLSAFWVLLAAAALVQLGNIPHYGLYVRRMDKPILLGALAGLTASIPLFIILVPRYGQLGSALSVLGAMTIIVITKTVALMQKKVST
jgi:O-antigen/teichoic acid export membrane protein